MRENLLNSKNSFTFALRKTRKQPKIRQRVGEDTIKF